MRFTPKTEKEIAEENLLPKGEYDYEVTEAADTKSKAGNEMIALKLRIYHGEGGGRIVNDYLMEAMPGKLRNFCAQHALLDRYESGTLNAADCEGRSGRVFIKIEKDKSGQYADKNAVAGYPAPKAGEAQREAAPAGGGFSVTDDDVPFMRYDVPCL